MRSSTRPARVPTSAEAAFNRLPICILLELFAYHLVLHLELLRFGRATARLLRPRSLLSIAPSGIPAIFRMCNNDFLRDATIIEDRSSIMIRRAIKLCSADRKYAQGTTQPYADLRSSDLELFNVIPHLPELELLASQSQRALSRPYPPSAKLSLACQASSCSPLCPRAPPFARPPCPTAPPWSRRSARFPRRCNSRLDLEFGPLRIGGCETSANCSMIDVGL